jgi:adenylosuccinate lyase
LEKELKHDVIAFLTSVAEFVGPDARYLHRGLTSSDVLDTALAVQLMQASDLLIKDIDKLLSILKFRAYEFKHTLQMGRSHGIHGEPITFGLKLALWYEEMQRNRKRLWEAREQIAVGKLSGAMGNFTQLEPFVEAYVCRKLKLKADPISTQIIQRDRHAHYFSILAVIAASLEKIATEIRHLQRTEVYEAEEYFAPGQKGSSAMPHKRNPVLSENVTGLARLLRGYAVSSLENVALWHERDISHSSVERVIGPDATIILDFMLVRMSGVIEKLVVYPENMLKNLNQMNGLFFSQRILLALTDKGCSREEAYRLVQKHAMQVWEEKADFLTELKTDARISRFLTPTDLEGLCDLNVYVRHVDTIFERVFGKEPHPGEEITP